jgi:hypothetical protein
VTKKTGGSMKIAIKRLGKIDYEERAKDRD